MIELSKDTSILGLKLLDIASKLLGHSNGEKRNGTYKIGKRRTRLLIKLWKKLDSVILIFFFFNSMKREENCENF